MAIVKSSNLPKIIKKESTHFAASGRWAKLEEGFILPIPGPTLLIAVAEAPMASLKFKPIKVSIIAPVTNVKRYKKRKARRL